MLRSPEDFFFSEQDRLIMLARLPDNLYNWGGILGITPDMLEESSAFSNSIFGTIDKINRNLRSAFFLIGAGCYAKAAIDYGISVINSNPPDPNNFIWANMGSRLLSLASSMYLKDTNISTNYINKE